VWEQHGQIDRIVAAWSGQHTDRFLPAADDVSLKARYIINDATGEPIGRLHVSVDPGYDKNEEPIHILSLTARGKPLGEGPSGIYSFFELGREWIVKGFASFTTKRMHQAWGRHDDR
jgi:hypothetical protein